MLHQYHHHKVIMVEHLLEQVDTVVAAVAAQEK
jgi:hypothetical protein